MLLLRVGVARPRLWFEDVILSAFMLKLFQKVALQYYSKFQFFFNSLDLLVQSAVDCGVEVAVVVYFFNNLK